MGWLIYFNYWLHGDFPKISCFILTISSDFYDNFCRIEVARLMAGEASGGWSWAGGRPQGPPSGCASSHVRCGQALGHTKSSGGPVPVPSDVSSASSSTVPVLVSSPPANPSPEPSVFPSGGVFQGLAAGRRPHSQPRTAAVRWPSEWPRRGHCHQLKPVKNQFFRASRFSSKVSFNCGNIFSNRVMKLSKSAPLRLPVLLLSSSICNAAFLV